MLIGVFDRFPKAAERRNAKCLVAHDETIKLFAVTVGENHLKTSVHTSDTTLHLIGSRHHLLQTIARKVGLCPTWPL